MRNKIFAVLVAALFGIAAHAAPQQITATVTGTSANLTLAANITVADPADTGKVGNLYVIAVWNGSTFVLGPNNVWITYNGSSIPAVRSGIVLGTHVVPIVSNPLDVTRFMGMVAYAGYGVKDQGDLLNGGKFAKIYTIAPPCLAGQTWTTGINACVGTKGTVFYQLPAGCNYATQQCFKDAGPFMTTVADGADSTIVWRLFKNTTYSGLWNVLPVHASDGTRAAADINGGSEVAFDAVWTAPPTVSGVPQAGVVIRQKDTVFCHLWTAAGSAFPATCPSN